jgi:hypothetical protein
MEAILGAAQSLVNFLFLVVVLGTAVVSWWLSVKYRERYAEFPWNKVAIVLGIEVLAWIAFNIFWNWVTDNWWIAIVLVVIIVLVLKKRRRE